MKKQYINIAAFLFCLFSIGIFNLFTKDKLVSELENRTLEQFPRFSTEKLFSGEYTKQVENYFADQFFMRDSFVGISSTIKEKKGLPGNRNAQIIIQKGFNSFEEQSALPPEEIEQPAKEPLTGQQALPSNSAGNTATPMGSVAPDDPDKGGRSTGNETQPSTSQPGSSKLSPPQPIQSQPVTPKSTPTDSQGQAKETGTPVPTKAPTKGNEVQTIGRVLIYNNSAMSLFTFNKGSAEYYAKTLNSFKEKVGAGVKVYSLLAPINTEFIDDEKYRSMSDSQKDAISFINERLMNIVSVDAYNPIREHKNEYVYFRTDHHWTALGAYYAYTGFAAAAGMEAVPLGKYETAVIKGYLGSMVDMTGSSVLKRNPDTITVYKPFVKSEYTVYYEGPVKLKVIDMTHADKKNKYRVFISGDRPLGIIKTEVKNGKKILIIKDSYGNAMVPFLLPHYQEVYVIDPRQYTKNVLKLIKDNGIQDVLFLNYVPILSYNGFTDLVLKVMNAG